MSEAEQKFYDATIKRIDIEAAQTVIETNDGEVKTFRKAFRFHHEGSRGVLAVYGDGDFRFWPYPDQRLRRWPEQDIPGDDEGGYSPFWGWRLDGSDEPISCRPHFIPGKHGRYVEDQTVPVEIAVPREFFELCEGKGLSVDQVLRGFIADVCGLQNCAEHPREDGFSSNGSDERIYAEQWFDRAYF